MAISDRQLLKQRARDALKSASYNPQRIVLIHTGAASIVTLLTAAVSFLIQDGISGTGGLSGIGLRTMLSTAGSVLQNITNLVLPFWAFGYLIFILKVLRRQPVGPSTLLESFRHMFPILRLLLIRGFIYIAIGFLCLYPSAIIFSLTPMAQPLEALLEPMLGLTTEAEIAMYMDDATVAAMTDALIPMLVIYAGLFLAIAIPVSYRLRFADYILLDNPSAGAIFALRASAVLLRRNCLDLFKLDLSFWWYYLIDTALIAVCYADVLLPMLGITLPFSSTTGFFLFYVLYFIGQLVFYAFARNRVEATYAAAYEQLRTQAQTC